MERDLPDVPADLLAYFPDPVERLLLTGEAATAHEAEALYLDRAYPETLALPASVLIDPAGNVVGDIGYASTADALKAVGELVAKPLGK